MAHTYPSNSKIQDAIVSLILETGGKERQLRLAEMYKTLADEFELTPKQKRATCVEVTGKGEDRPYWDNLVRTAKARLIENNKLLPSTGHGLCKLNPDLFANISVDISEPEGPERATCVIYRIIRDTGQTRKLKDLYNHRCQLCTLTIQLPNHKCYSEAHHIRPLGKDHNGPDTANNILVLCPNCHAKCDLGAMKLSLDSFQITKHAINPEFLAYHNSIHKWEL